MKLRSKVLYLATAAIMAAMLFGVQVAMASLPNIELVSFLVMVCTLVNKKLAAAAIAVFVLLEGLLFGFHLWWASYLYIWYILMAATLLLRKWLTPLFAALLCGAFGLLFGTLTSLPYWFTAGPGGAIAYIIAGFPFDIAHCLGNFVLALILFAPMQKLLPHLQKLVPEKQPTNPP